MEEPRNIKIIEPFIVLVVIAGAIVYLLNVFNSGSWLWFQGKATVLEPPTRIVIINDGEAVVLQPGSDYFNELSEAAVQALSKFGNTDLVSIGLSEQTLTDYAENSLVVELYFDKPLQFNTLARTGEPTQLLIPVDGRHAAGGYVFRGAQGEWWFGAVRMADPSPLYVVLQQMGYQAAVFQSAG
ncbi:MAG: hypothetical protein IPM53_33055 [Anaerolineaceae bacterium]|nr:hypothetical protein [Anaerolineaceae bacterium]